MRSSSVERRVGLSAGILLSILLLLVVFGYRSQVEASVPGVVSLSEQGMPEAEGQVEAWTRTLDPVILAGSQLPLFSGVTLGDLFVYRFDGSTWAEVPFQFDEVGSTDPYTYTSFEDGLLDSNDELVFMAKDLGVTAEPNQWLGDSDSRNYSRYAVKVTNPLASGEEGWVYIYRSATLTSSFSSYVTWDGTENRIIAGTYIAGYDPTVHMGLDSLKLNGTGVDILDRSKVRVSGKCYQDGDWNIFSKNEDSQELMDKWEPPDMLGPVRVGGGTLASFQWAYRSLFRTTSEFDASYSGEQCEQLIYTLFRLSDDWLNPSESGMAPMTYYDSNTSGGVAVDGNYDTIATTPVAGWREVTGARGTYVQVASVSDGGGTAKNYYYDYSDSDPEDTGDQMSFGDGGYQVENPTGTVSMSFANYYLDANIGNVGATYKQYQDNPLQTTLTSYGYLATPTLNAIDNADGNGDYLVDWNDVTNATGYELQEDDNSSFSSPTVRYSGSASQYQVTGQATGLYYYRVRASHSAGNSLWSSTQSVGVVPAAPTLSAISNSDGNGDYLVDWSDVTGATSYTLQEDDNSGFSSPTARYSGSTSQYQVTGQGSGLWYYRVRASNAGGDSPWSSTQSVGVVPVAPTLSAIDNPDGNGDYVVDWNDVSGATSYTLQEDDNSSFSSPTVRYSGSSSQYQVYGQDSGVWYYRVRASNSGGDSPWSSTQSVNVLSAAPVLSAISNPDGNGDYLVDWGDVTGATSYTLQEDDNSSFSSPTVRYTGTDTQYQVTGQGSGVWYYRVRASNAGGDSAWSNTESAGVVPAAPTLSAISNPDGNGDYLVDWNDVTGATSYTLQEDDNSSFSSPTVKYTGGTSQYQVIGQTGGTWYYRVRASNIGGDSAWSNTQSVGVSPAAPTLNAISNSDGNGDYLVDWGDVATATSYRLEEDDNSSFSSPAVRYTGTDTQYQVTGQGTGLWYYRVRASNAYGDGSWSNTESAGVVPPAPSLIAIDNPDGNGDYMVDWSDVTGATGYTLQEDDNSSFSSPAMRYSGTDTQYQVTGQATGLWYYRVRASNAYGDGSWSNTQSAGVVPSVPTLSAIDNPDGNGDYLVDWSDVTAATGYTLQEDDNSSFTSPTVKYTGATSQYQVSGQASGLWYYRVRASNAGGDSAWSNTQSVSVLSGAPLLAAISNSDGNGDYLVDWSDVTGATGYTLQEDDNSSFSSPTVRYSGSTSQYQVYGQGTGLWYYRVRASNAGGDGAWSNTESVGVMPAAPTLSAISNSDGNGDYLVDWSDVTGATGYTLQEDDNSGFSSPTVRYSGPTSQYQVTGQATGLWYYRVRASNAGGDSPWSNAKSVGVVPAAPVLSAISNADEDGDYLVDWSDVTGAIGYTLQEDDNADFLSPTVRFSGSASQYQVTDQGGGTWYYRVRASNAGGDSAWSNYESAVSNPPLLGAPALSTIDNADADGNYLVDWSDVAEASEYTLQEDNDPYFTSPLVLYKGAASQYQVAGQGGGTWYYRVLASASNGKSPWSNSQSTNVIPAVPEFLPIDNSDGDGNYLVDWGDVGGATGYRLEEDDNSGFASPTVRYEGSSSEYQVTSQAGGTWHYRVRASNAGGNSPWSSNGSVSVAPLAPELLGVSNPEGYGDYLVDWSDVTGANSYRLEEDDNSSFSSPTVRYTGANSQYQVYGQGTGLWYYRVRASNAYGDSLWSNTQPVGVVPDSPVLSAISNADGDGDYLVDWGAVTGATSYRLEEDGSSAFDTPTVLYNGTDTQYQVSGQETGLWYHRVRASNAGGDSPWSTVKSVGVVPASPTLAAISNSDGNGDFLVDWTDVTGATSYRLEEDDNAAFSSPEVRYTGASSQYQVYGQETGLWYYRVRASNAGGDSVWSDTQSVGVLPAAPVLASISNSDGNGEYLVDWSDVRGASTYTLQEDDNSGFSSPIVLYTGAASQYQVTGQGTGLWYYRVRATNAGGDGSWSNTRSVSVVPVAPVLAAIGNADGDGEYLVDWSDVAGATIYRLEQDDNSGFSSPTVRYSGSASQYQASGQPTGLWYYRVRAHNAQGDSPWSNTTSVGVVPAAPVLAAISNAEGDGAYLVDWSAVAQATSYVLEEDDNAAFTSPAVRYTGDVHQYQVNGQESGLWYYRVRASNVGGNSAWSNTESVSVLPGTPVLAAINNPEADGEYLVDWSDVTGVTTFRLEEDDSPAFDSPTLRYSGPDSQYQVSGQATGLWYYRVRASSAGGDSAWSNTESVGVAPAAPVLAAISNPDGDSEYLVDWGDVTSATGYELQEDDNSAFDSPVVRYDGTASQYQAAGQETGLWYYRVRASNAGGDGAWSNIESAGVVPATPALTAISNPEADGEYLVDWSDVTAASYRLEEDDNSGFTSPTLRYDGSESQYQVAFQAGGTWYYRVRAGNAGGNSLWSNIESASVIPGAPELLPVDNSNGDGEYLVNWSDAMGATSYRLEEDDSSTFDSPAVRYAGSDSQCQVSGQETGVWYYRVRASNAGGDSSWSNTEAVEVLAAAPELLPISNPDGNGSYLVDWTDVSGATGYLLEEDDNPGFDSPATRYQGTASQLDVSEQPSGTWYYRVRAHNEVGSGAWSAAQPVSVTFGWRVCVPLILRGSAGGR